MVVMLHIVIQDTHGQYFGHSNGMTFGRMGKRGHIDQEIEELNKPENVEAAVARLEAKLRKEFPYGGFISEEIAFPIIIDDPLLNKFRGKTVGKYASLFRKKNVPDKDGKFRAGISNIKSLSGDFVVKVFENFKEAEYWREVDQDDRFQGKFRF
jgi:hypothetical protein